MVAYGTGKLSLTVATYLGMATISKLTAQAVGIGDEQDRDLDLFLPQWEQYHDRIYLSKEDGVVTYIDFGYTNPLTHISNVFKAVFTDHPDRDGWNEVAADIYTILEPFVGADILAERLLDIRAGQSQSGTSIYSPHDTAAGKTADVAEYMWDVLEPGIGTSTRKLYKALKQRGLSEIELEGVRQYDLQTETSSLLLGMRVQKIPIKRQWGFYLNNFTKDMPKTKALYSRKYYKSGIPDEVNKARLISKAHDARERLLNQARKRFQVASDFGVNPYDLGKAMERAQIPKAYRWYIEGSVDIKYVNEIQNYGE
jgi:hypothetical protein